MLGIDVGSSSVKASLVDAATGVSVASAFYPKTEAEIIAVRNGWAEQDPESWWENTKLAVFEGANRADFADAIPLFMVTSDDESETISTDRHATER